MSAVSGFSVATKDPLIVFFVVLPLVFGLLGLTLDPSFAQEDGPERSTATTGEGTQPSQRDVPSSERDSPEPQPEVETELEARTEAETPEGETGASRNSPRQGRPGGRVLLPGGKAWNPPGGSRGADPAKESRANRTEDLPDQPTRESPAIDVREGIIYWTGKLVKNRIVVIEAGESNHGLAEGDLLPGKAVDVHVFSPAIRLVERPRPANDWKRVAFRCLQNKDRSVTLNIQWTLRR